MSVRTANQGTQALREALRCHGGTVAALVDNAVPASSDDRQPGPAQVAARGPRALGHESEYELLIEMIQEGSRLHYGRARVVQTDDADLALLLGDQLYALGLARLAALGDLAAIVELADVISLVAQASAVSDEALADAVWAAGAVAIGWGASAPYAAAKRLARAGHERSRAALAEAAQAPSS